MIKCKIKRLQLCCKISGFNCINKWHNFSSPQCT